MARIGGDYDSASSQFFIVHGDSQFLDGNYATFGGLIDGFNVLDYIALVNTSSADAPIETVIIESITVELNGYVATDPICAD
jgi:peptidyl-prolyl cis-trans isomerase B (cyclophilin B)